LEKSFNKFTSNVFFFFSQLRFKTEPEDLSSAIFIGRRFVDVDENRFFGNVNEVEGTLFLCVSVERAVVDRARTIFRASKSRTHSATCGWAAMN